MKVRSIVLRNITMGSIALKRSLRIGVDVGGTNTDAVVLDISAVHTPDRGVLASHKSPTTSPNVTDGIEAAVKNVLEQADNPIDEISCLVIGTTHFINAIVEHDVRRLSKVAIVRLSKSFTKEIPPFSDFPPDLAEILNGYYGYVDGGLHIDGAEEAPIVESQVIEQCKAIRERGISAVVVSGVFSPIDHHFRQEAKVRDILQRELPGVDIVCSSDVSNIGFLERENASILNASILKYARRTVRGFKAAMKRLHLTCALFLSQNDGTLIDAASAARLPIRTFSSGPTNSMRGAAYLGLAQTGSKDEKRTATIVVDVGGTTTDVGVLLPSGFPRQASAYVTVAGVKINFPMPHVESIGLGGGSIIRMTEGNKMTVGPDSVGYQLTAKAKVFGGDILTATDIAVAAGEKIGNSTLLKALPHDLVASAQATMKKKLEAVIDIMKMSPEPLPVLLVGGGSVICPKELDGISELIIPRFHGVANAVGAAISNVGGSVDIIQNTSTMTAAEAVQSAKDLAIERAIAAGANAGSVDIAEVDAMPLQYVADQLRVVARAVGELSSQALDNQPKDFAIEGADEEDCEEEGIIAEKLDEHNKIARIAADIVDVNTYRPRVLRHQSTGHPEWILSEIDIDWLKDGCYVLGCAGGGSPTAQYIQLRDQFRAGHTVRVIDATALSPDALIYWGGNMGSPAVSVERLAQTETLQAVEELMEYFRHESFDAVMGLEIGGANGLEPLLLGSTKAFDRPVIDADWMGRAYPTYWQTTICVYDSGQLVPCAIASGDGKSIIMTKAPNDEIVDRALRASCSEMGSRVGMAARPTTTDRVIKYGILNTLSLAWRIGRCIARARTTNTLNTVVEQIVEEIGGSKTAKVLFRGKIVNVERRLYKGHSYGEITIRQTDESELESTTSIQEAVATGGVLKIPFKNENIYAKHIAEDGTEKYIAMVPDLISVLDTQSGKALGVPEFRYGVMVTVLGITCSPRWTDTPKGLEIGGPAAFGYHDLKYVPLGEYVEPQSVVLEYAPDS